MAALRTVVLVALLSVAQVCVAKPIEEETQTSSSELGQFLSDLMAAVAETADDINNELRPLRNGTVFVKEERHKIDAALPSITRELQHIEEGVRRQPIIALLLKKSQEKIDQLKKDPETAPTAHKVVEVFETADRSLAKQMTKVIDDVNREGGLRDSFDEVLGKIIDSGTGIANEFTLNLKNAVKELKDSKAVKKEPTQHTK